jgi:hypothetical protein
MASSDGGVFSFGGVPFYGSMGGQHLNKPVVGMASTPDGGGYWLVASDGGVFSFGDAGFHGSTGNLKLVKPVVGMAADPATGGYWLVASDGGVFSFGAPFYGSMGGKPIPSPVVGMAATPDGGGYWLVDSEGDVFPFGNAHFYGSMKGTKLYKPVIGIQATASGQGYWLVAADGGIFNFGDADFDGSPGGTALSSPIVAMAPTPDAKGYWMVNANGGVFSYGNALNGGSAGGNLNAPVVSMAEGPGNGDPPGAVSYAPGSYGYDISNYQCSSYPPAPYTIGIVEVAGSPRTMNPCLAGEAAWAGYYRQLYLFLVSPDQPGENGDMSGPYGNCASTDNACIAHNYGYNTVMNAVAYARQQGAMASVWWLDVESVGSCVDAFPVGSFGWSCDGALNADLIDGALNAFQNMGLTAGIYSSIHEWGLVMNGDTSYQPPVPEWVANWNYPSDPSHVCNSSFSFAGGPIWMVQYTDNAGGYDGDYSC